MNQKKFGLILIGVGEDDAMWYNTLAEAEKEWKEFKKLGYKPILVKVIK
jgi:hypothetical protein